MRGRKVLLLIFVILIVILQYKIWFAKDGLIRLWYLKRVTALQIQKNDALKKHNEVLEYDIEALKQGNAVEEHARNDLGMIRKGETFYRIVKQPQ